MVYPDWCILHCKGYQDTHRCFIDDCTEPQTRNHTNPEIYSMVEIESTQPKQPKLIIHHTNMIK